MSSPYAWFNSAHEERMARFRNAGLYLVTSESLSEGRSTLEIVSLQQVTSICLQSLDYRDQHSSTYLMRLSSTHMFRTR